MKHAAALLAAFFAFALGLPAAYAESRGFTATYNVSLRGIGVGEFDLSLETQNDSYAARAERKATGLLRAAVGSSQDYRYEAEGRVEGGALVPERYEHQGGKKNRLVKVAFNGATNVTTATPAMGMGSPPATPAQRANTIDQVTALTGMALASNPCSGAQRILMDGARRFDFVFSPAGRKDVRTRAYRGSALRCTVQFKPIAGFSDPTEPAQLEFLFAEATSGVYVPIRIQMPTDEGMAVFDAKSFTVRK